MREQYLRRIRISSFFSEDMSTIETATETAPATISPTRQSPTRQLLQRGRLEVLKHPQAVFVGFGARGQNPPPIGAEVQGALKRSAGPIADRFRRSSRR